VPAPAGVAGAPAVDGSEVAVPVVAADGVAEADPSATAVVLGQGGRTATVVAVVAVVATTLVVAPPGPVVSVDPVAATVAVVVLVTAVSTVDVTVAHCVGTGVTVVTPARTPEEVGIGVGVALLVPLQAASDPTDCAQCSAFYAYALALLWGRAAPAARPILE
jgi:hypothetical protein